MQIELQGSSSTARRPPRVLERIATQPLLIYNTRNRVLRHTEGATQESNRNTFTKRCLSVSDKLIPSFDQHCVDHIERDGHPLEKAQFF